ncbi:(2Fe-2S)-binding protein [Ammoniphilus sp. YIM 78166]|uniref:(2Fe-2S)-binding protein n=1 Tax=Ammoniphilus sp. YIM 78166 TaxID=1644106 RepID=UPI00196A9AEF|nr:(2Fe-2S)-binding protein [Ammoniphilus sp. YIM 78166]
MIDQKEIIVCRCEEVTLGELLETSTNYPCSSRELKLRTRAGMGFCGGRTCRSLVDAIVKEVNGKATADTMTLRYQPPVRPISFHLLGGINEIRKN